MLGIKKIVQILSMKQQMKGWFQADSSKEWAAAFPYKDKWGLWIQKKKYRMMKNLIHQPPSNLIIN